MDKNKDVVVRSILDLNIMVINYIRYGSTQNVIKTLYINEEMVMLIKGMNSDQIYKLTETNQLLVKIKNSVIDDHYNMNNNNERG
ncbi:TPA: flagellar transcriptional regulator FlhD [Enterobacter cloacae]|nr:flagellar transcriptional regulator FlhD [Enterobacter cloacae]